MFTKFKLKQNTQSISGFHNPTNIKDEMWSQGRYEAPWLGKHFFGVMLTLFGMTIAGVAFAVLSGNFS